MTRLAFTAVLAVVLAGPLPAREELSVTLVLPAYGQALFGEVEVGAEVYPSEAEVERVEFYLDDELVGLVERPPYRQLVDAGQENVGHHFLVVVHGAAGKSARAEAYTPRIETDEEISVELQQLYVTVERRGGRVLDLERGDFTVFDNGAVQEIVTFERGDVPFTAVLAVDASTSMEGERLRIALSGAEAFVDGMRELDQAKLVLFADRLLHETPFTNFATVLTVGLSGVRAGGGTALNDYLYLALKRLGSKQGRRVVVILSDGIDVESVLKMEHVAWAASQHQPVLYWIRLPENPKRVSLWRGMEEHVGEYEGLRRAVAESGGRIVDLESIGGGADAFRAILEDLRNQYVLGYYPRAAAAGGRGLHKIEVELRDAELLVRTRSSYLEPTRWKGGRGE